MAHVPTIFVKMDRAGACDIAPINDNVAMTAATDIRAMYLLRDISSFLSLVMFDLLLLPSKINQHGIQYTSELRVSVSFSSTHCY